MLLAFASQGTAQVLPEPIAPGVAQPGNVVPPSEPVAPSLRRFRIVPRSSLPFQVDWRETAAGESVAVLSGGINVLIEGVQVPELGTLGLSPDVGTIDIMADRAVVWARGVQAIGESAGVQTRDMPFEVYLEGNIVFRQGDRVVYANRMFYDAQRQVGVILNAELLTPVPEYKGRQYEGLVRLRAGAVRQLNETQFLAQDALITTSRLEEPSYHVAAGSILFEDRQRPKIDAATGLPIVDSTGTPQIDHQMMATARNNRVYIAGIPVFYWPTIATDLERPTYYVNNLRVRNDSIFGTQALVDLDAYQLLGIRDRPGTDWDVSVDWLSKRGIGWGSTYDYADQPFPVLPGTATGVVDIWGIKDRGLDFLGRGRQGVLPDKDFRGRALWQHRHLLGDGWQLTGQVGWLSDRDFLEQYYEQDYDQAPDAVTGLELKQTRDNQSASIRANARLNNFLTQTQWLPRFDHFWLGQSLLGDRLTWYEHTSLSYANIGLASMPTDPTLAAIWTRLPWELNGGVPINVAGERFVTRHELDLPFSLGPVRVVPFALGELGHWGQDIAGNDLQRAYFQTGLRASVPFWAVYPDVCNPIFNLSGLAHKVVFDAEATYADANRNYDQFPLYDPLDDDSIEEFRRRLFFHTFGGALPLRFDPRTYALRGGLQGWVASPAMEMAEDLEAVRVGMRHRWQTKRGAPGRQRIVDWLTFDTNGTWFPKPNRDNFGQDVGLVDYDMRWHVGDRFTVVSDGAADFFSDGLKTVSGGVFIHRPDRGNGYIGFRTVDGPFRANVLTGSFAYRMTQKWVSTSSASVDFSTTGNIGQTFSLSRIGESLIVTAGLHVDSSKGNVSAIFLVEPRFFTSRLTRTTGLVIPPIGVYEIE